MHFRWTQRQIIVKVKLQNRGSLNQMSIKRQPLHAKNHYILDMSVDTDVNHYICRILANFLNSGRSYLIVYQSYFSQVLNRLPYKNACWAVMQVDRDFYTVVSDTPYNYLFNHIKLCRITFGCKG